MSPQEKAVLEAARVVAADLADLSNTDELDMNQRELVAAVRALEPPRRTEPKYGDLVRVHCSATGRYLADGLAIYVSAQDNDLGIDAIDLDRDPWENAPRVTDRELSAAHTAFTSSKRLRNLALKQLAEVTP